MSENNLKEKFGITKGKNIDLNKFESVIEALKNGDVTEEEVAQLLNNIPNAVEVQKAYLDTVKTAFNSVKEVQVEAQKNISSERYIQTLEKLLEQNPSEKIQIEIIQTIKEIAKMTLETTERMNESNNTFWQKAVLSVGSVVVVAGAAIGAWIKFKDGNKTL